MEALFCSALLTLASPFLSAAPLSEAAEFEKFRRNAAAAASLASAGEEEKLRQEFAAGLDKSLIRQAAEGVYEVNLNPAAKDQFSNPDLAALGSGEVILYYSPLLADAKRYQGLLQSADIDEYRDGNGVLRFYKNQEKISSFEAFSRLNTEDFLDRAPAFPQLTEDQKKTLKGVLEAQQLVPLAVRRNPGAATLAMKVFDAKARAIHLISLPTLDGSRPSFPDLYQSLKDPKKISS